MKTLFFVAAIGLIVLAGRYGSRAQEYFVLDLGGIPGVTPPSDSFSDFYLSEASGINNSAQVVGLGNPSPNVEQALYWQIVTSLPGPGLPPFTPTIAVALNPPAGRIATSATAINDSGQIVGTGLYNSDSIGLFWSSPTAGQGTILPGGLFTAQPTEGVPPPGSRIYQLQPSAINPRGLVVGTGSTTLSAYVNGTVQMKTATIPVFWSPNTYTSAPYTSANQLGLMYDAFGNVGVDNSGQAGAATGVNSDSTIVGWYVDLGGTHHAVVWTDEEPNNAIIQNLDTSTADTYATAVNESLFPGQMNPNLEIVGYGPNGALYWPFSARTGNFLRTQSLIDPSGFQEFGNETSKARGLNDSGQIVGSGFDAKGEQHAIIWPNNSSAGIDLNTVKINQPNMVLVWATSINNSGVIVGYGLVENNGSPVWHGYALYPQPVAMIAPGFPRRPPPGFVDTFGIFFQMCQDCDYEVQRSSGFGSNAWSTITANIPGIDGVFTNIDASGTNGPQVFYRLKMNPANGPQAIDNAANFIYGSGWTNGITGGMGLGAWTLTASSQIGNSNNGFFIGSSISNADVNAPGIDVAGDSWGIYANNGNLATAYRAFIPSLPIGQTLRLDMDNGYVNANGSVGFVLRNGNASASPTSYNTGARFEFLYAGPNPGNSYSVIDATGTHSVGVPWTGTGLHLIFNLITTNTYTLWVFDNLTGAATNFSGTLSGSGTVDSVALFNNNSGSGPAYAVYFNSLSLSGFIGPLAPVVSTLGATNITDSTAVLMGDAIPNGADSVAWFQWGTDTNYGNLTPSTFVSATNVLVVNNLITGLSPGTLYHYQLVGSNSAGTGTGGDVTFITGESSCVAPPSGPVHWWPGESNADDIIGGDTGILEGGVTYTSGEVGDAFSFNGANGYVSTSLVVTNPQTFSLTLWFKTTTTNGGVLMSFDSSPTNKVGSSYDRNIYMDDTGALHFGVWNGGPQQINSSGGYNDGNWHYVVGSLSTNTALSLYIDGVLFGNNTAVTNAQEIYNGYWRIGQDNLDNWPPQYQPRSYYFQGQIDEVAIFDSAIAATNVSAIYGAGTNGMCQP